MNRIHITLLSFLGFGLIASSLFVVENEVQSMRDDLSEINRQIIADREAIHIMQAEWAYLTQPERIAMLTKTNLPDMSPQQSSQYYSAEAAMIALNKIHKENQAAEVSP